MALRIGRPYQNDPSPIFPGAMDNGYQAVPSRWGTMAMPPMAVEDEPDSMIQRGEFMPAGPSGTRAYGVTLGGQTAEPPPVDLNALNAIGRNSTPQGPSRPMYGNRSRPEQQIDIKFAQDQSPEVMRAFHGRMPEDIHWRAPGTSSLEEDDFRRDMGAMSAPPPAPQSSSSEADYNARQGDWSRRRGQALGRMPQHLTEAEQSGNEDVTDFLMGATGQKGQRRDPLRDENIRSLIQNREFNQRKPQPAPRESAQQKAHIFKLKTDYNDLKMRKRSLESKYYDPYIRDSERQPIADRMKAIDGELQKVDQALAAYGVDPEADDTPQAPGADNYVSPDEAIAQLVSAGFSPEEAAAQLQGTY